MDIFGVEIVSCADAEVEGTGSGFCVCSEGFCWSVSLDEFEDDELLMEKNGELVLLEFHK